MPRRALRSYPTKYATDLTDEQWAAIAPLVTAPSHGGGRPTEIDRRAIVNALRSKHRTGCQWRMLPRGKQRSTGANGNAGLIRMGSCCACSSIQRTFQIPKARNGFWPRIISRFLECARFGWMKDTNKG